MFLTGKCFCFREDLLFHAVVVPAHGSGLKKRSHIYRLLPIQMLGEVQEETGSAKSPAGRQVLPEQVSGSLTAALTP